MESIHGWMETFMMENGKMTVETAKVFINGQMEINTKENG